MNFAGILAILKQSVFKIVKLEPGVEEGHAHSPSVRGEEAEGSRGSRIDLDTK